ncbi:MAG: 1-acyl-sn-glycerol-3-phosphate acyltransferase [Bacilli bacterium]|nr:1-acyl-sn-glycerol-3-phosphate acyltransferase [Bacilli bacterium]
MKRYDDVFLYKLLRPIITLLFKVLYSPKIVGANNIKKSGKVILAGNHNNNLDGAILISSTKRNIHFLAKIELFKGIKKIFFNNFGLIPVDRSKRNRKSLEMAYEYLKNDKVIGIFPEGTFGKGKILPFKLGAVKMAYETNSEIVPFAITGNFKIFSKNLKIEFGKPIKIKSDNLEKENENLRNIVVGMVNNNEHI